MTSTGSQGELNSLSIDLVRSNYYLIILIRQVPRCCTSAFPARWVCGGSRCTNRSASATKSTSSSASAPASWTTYKMPLTSHRPSGPDSAATAPSTASLRSTEAKIEAATFHFNHFSLYKIIFFSFQSLNAIDSSPSSLTPPTPPALFTCSHAEFVYSTVMLKYFLFFPVLLSVSLIFFFPLE